MHGNVEEWCQDQYHDTYFGAPTDGSAWLKGGRKEIRVLRGGAWLTSAFGLRSTYHGSSAPGARINSIGFRLVAVARAQ
jgi:formylglycine-generating enzyme required for sulfatase activity